MPSATTFAGLALNDTCTGGQCGDGWPPDINGDVGLNHYIVGVNSSFGVYDKTTGTRLAAFTENSLFSSGPTGTLCDTDSYGDPVVLYDTMADRWILTNFAFGFDSRGNTVSPYYQCWAVSKTADPVSGGWWLYALRMDPGGTGQPSVGYMNDYGKAGVWTDCVYFASNEFTTRTYKGVAVASLSRSDMEKGASLTWSLAMINGTGANGSIFTVIPANARGNTPGAVPPAGRPGFLVNQQNGSYGIDIRTFTAGPNCGGGGTISSATTVTEASGWGSPAAVPQSGTTNTLDSLGYRLMQKVQYRKVGSAESLWLTNTVQNSGVPDAPHWMQVNVNGGTINTTPVQEGIHSPDTTMYRWMGSIAADNAGNASLGYSTSNSSSFPSIKYAGRLATDTANTLPQTETTMQAGGGSQTNNCGGAPCDRWGDYTAMSVDPVDDCTFWYTNEYYDTATHGTSGIWQTRVGAFGFGSSHCTPSPVSATPHTLNFDGAVGSDWNASKELLGSAGSSGANTFGYYATWDATSLTVGAKGVTPGDYTYVAVVDTDPKGSPNTGSIGSLACGGGIDVSRCFKGNFALVRTGATLTTAGSTSADAGGSGSWGTWSPSTGTGAKDWGRTMAEFQFAWTDMGITPGATSPIAVQVYVCNGTSLISSWPSTNPQSGTSPATTEIYFPSTGSGFVPNTAAVSPGAPSITSANGTAFTSGSFGTFTVTTTGNPTPALSESGALPSGITFVDNGNGTATLSGTTSSVGAFAITITAHGWGCDATQSFTLSVNSAPTAPTITSTSSTTFTVGTAGTFSVTTTGYPVPTITKTGALPSAVTLTDNGDGTATLAGTPAAGTGGSYPITITAANGVAPTANQSFTLTVNQAAPTISTITPGCANVIGGLSVTITGTNFQTGAAVTLVGTPATVTDVTPTQITATTGPATPGHPITGDVFITNPDTQTFTLGNAFTYAIRGDADDDLTVGPLDIFFLINKQFAGGPSPITLCNGDADSDNTVGPLDIFFLINKQFAGGPPPGP